MRFPAWIIFVLIFAFCFSMGSLAFAQYDEDEEEEQDDSKQDDDDDDDSEEDELEDDSPDGDNLARAHDDSEDIGGCGY